MPPMSPVPAWGWWTWEAARGSDAQALVSGDDTAPANWASRNAITSTWIERFEVRNHRIGAILETTGSHCGESKSDRQCRPGHAAAEKTPHRRLDQSSDPRTEREQAPQRPPPTWKVKLPCVLCVSTESACQRTR